jgi:hypothetical protein
MEATYSSETSVGFQRATQRYVAEERTNYRYKNLKFYKIIVICCRFLKNQIRKKGKAIPVTGRGGP